MTNKYNLGDVVYYRLGPNMAPVEVVGIKESGFGGYEYTVRSEQAGTIQIHETNMKTKDHTSDRVPVDIVSISDRCAAECMAEWTTVATAAANTTPSLYTYAELMNKIKYVKLKIDFI